MNFSCRLVNVVIKFNNFRDLKNIPKHYTAYRFYSRDTEHRIPSKVYSPDGESEWVPESEGTVNYRAKQLRLKRHSEREVIELDEDELVEKSSAKGKSEESDENNEPQGTNYRRLSSREISRFVESVSKTQAKNQRNKSSLIMLEGKRLIQDAILAGVIPKEIFFSRKNLVEDLEMPPGVVKLFQLPYRSMALYSSVKTPPGIVAFCKMPKQKCNDGAKAKAKEFPVSIVCDNIRDPGNLGGIIRTVAAVGCSNLILTEGCTDPWNPSVLRAGAGAHFRINIISGVAWHDIPKHVAPDCHVFLADSSTANLTDIDNSADNLTDIDSSADNLTDIDSSAANLTDMATNAANLTDMDSSAANPATRREFALDALPIVPYYSVDFASLNRALVLVLGGETHGLSVDARMFARYRDGTRVHVPIANDVDSLSVNAAASCILFEIKRQFVVDNCTSPQQLNRAISN